MYTLDAVAVPPKELEMIRSFFRRPGILKNVRRFRNYLCNTFRWGQLHVYQKPNARKSF
jgi:hypothetical protein